MLKVKNTQIGKYLAGISLAVLMFNNTLQGLTFFGFTFNVETINLFAILSLILGLLWVFSE